VVPETGIEVSFDNSFKLFTEYCAKVSHGSARLAELLCPTNGTDMAVIIPGPDGGCKIADREINKFLGEVPSQVKDRDRSCYVAVLALHRKGWLTPRNEASDVAIRATAWPLPLADDIHELSLDPSWFPANVLGDHMLQPTSSVEHRMKSDMSRVHSRDEQDIR